MIRLTNVEKHYKEFDLKCTLEVKPGCITGLVGENGSGKSTTFKAILGLVHADSGQVEVFGKPVNELTQKDREKIGVILADSAFSGYLKVSDIVQIMAAMYSKFEKEAFLADCKKYKIPLDKQMKDFSTGMKTKVKFLVAVHHGAELLILDEPTSGLDVVARDEYLELLQDYMTQSGRSILISSHISSDLENLCDDLYMIHEGQIILHEETDKLLNEYGILKVNEEQYGKLDKKYLIKVKNENYGYRCLTDQRQFYLENYPEIVVEKGNIDDMILLMIRGENA